MTTINRHRLFILLTTLFLMLATSHSAMAAVVYTWQDDATGDVIGEGTLIFTLSSGTASDFTWSDISTSSMSFCWGPPDCVPSYMAADFHSVTDDITASGGVLTLLVTDIGGFTFTENWSRSGSEPVANGQWTVVPVPAAVWLFGSGLLGLVGMARRKQAV